MYQQQFHNLSPAQPITQAECGPAPTISLRYVPTVLNQHTYHLGLAEL